MRQKSLKVNCIFCHTLTVEITDIWELEPGTYLAHGKCPDCGFYQTGNNMVKKIETEEKRPQERG